MAARSYQGSVPISTTSRTRKLCAVRMMAPMLNGFFARSTATRKGWRIRSSSSRTSLRGIRSGGTFAIQGFHLMAQPMAGVGSKPRGSPASTASSTLRRSRVVTAPGSFQLSSIRPL